jgi:hypothetical protein
MEPGGSDFDPGVDPGEDPGAHPDLRDFEHQMELDRLSELAFDREEERPGRFGVIGATRAASLFGEKPTFMQRLRDLAIKQAIRTAVNKIPGIGPVIGIVAPPVMAKIKGASDEEVNDLAGLGFLDAQTLGAFSLMGKVIGPGLQSLAIAAGAKGGPQSFGAAKGDPQPSGAAAPPGSPSVAGIEPSDVPSVTFDRDQFNRNKNILDRLRRGGA